MCYSQPDLLRLDRPPQDSWKYSRVEITYEVAKLKDINSVALWLLDLVRHWGETFLDDNGLSRKDILEVPEAKLLECDLVCAPLVSS